MLFLSIIIYNSDFSLEQIKHYHSRKHVAHHKNINVQVMTKVICLESSCFNFTKNALPHNTGGARGGHGPTYLRLSSGAPPAKTSGPPSGLCSNKKRRMEREREGRERAAGLCSSCWSAFRLMLKRRVLTSPAICCRALERERERGTWVFAGEAICRQVFAISAPTRWKTLAPPLPHNLTARVKAGGRFVPQLIMISKQALHPQRKIFNSLFTITSHQQL